MMSDTSLPPLFDGLAHTELVAGLGLFQKVEVDFGQPLMKEGEVDPSIICVVDGLLEVSTGGTTLGTAGRGEVLGEGALFGEGVRTASVESSTPSTLLLLDRTGYERLRDDDHPLAKRIEAVALKNLIARLRRTDKKIAEQATGTPVEHVQPPAVFFKRVAALFGSGGALSLMGVNAEKALANSVMFRGAPPEALAELARHMSDASYGGGHFLCTEGEHGDRMFFLVDGLVDVVVATDEDLVEPVATLDAGDAFGMAALFDDRPRSASCIARTKATVLVLKRKAFEGLYLGDGPGPRWLRTAMIRSLIEQLAYANAQLAQLELKEKTERIADLAPLLRASAGLEANGAHLRE